MKAALHALIALQGVLLLVFVAWAISDFGFNDPVKYQRVGGLAGVTFAVAYLALKRAPTSSREFCLKVIEIMWAVAVVVTLLWQASGAAQSLLDPKIHEAWQKLKEHGQSIVKSSKKLHAMLATPPVTGSAAEFATLSAWLSEVAQSEGRWFIHSIAPPDTPDGLAAAERELLGNIRWLQRAQAELHTRTLKQQATRNALVFGREWTIYLFALAAASGLKLAKALLEAHLSWRAIPRPPLPQRRTLRRPVTLHRKQSALPMLSNSPRRRPNLRRASVLKNK